MRAPDFWFSDNPLARLLEPVGQIVGGITARRALKTPLVRADVPVICVGNLTTGGTGKTPVVASIVRRLADQGQTPAVVMRGYGGSLKGPVRVDARTHTVDDVGDEALLHTRRGAVWVSRERARAAGPAIAAGAGVLVMDDGHQHSSLAKDLSLIVIDGRTGFGNGRLFPAGPLREPIRGGLARAQAAVIMGEDRLGIAKDLSEYLPVLSARLVPGPERMKLKGQRVVAFAGIGDPEKFYHTLREIGARVNAFHPFDDHYSFDVADIQPILDEAFAIGAIPVTTEKDAVRLEPDQRQQVDVLSVDVEWDRPETLDALLDKIISGNKI
ncbi:MAG: tetraacyldisaccharide 4'-kinase [Proteobacteria bacterium]|nr:tetraacyldisaccharide 4'-kinase [Pseudomonadota bacterium]